MVACYVIIIGKYIKKIKKQPKITFYTIKYCYKLYSNYPAKRRIEDSEKVEMGVVGTVNLVQNVTLSTQPICSYDWSPDKMGLAVCGAFDQTLRVIIVTKLNML